MSNYDNFNPTDRAELEQMSTEELNEILDASMEPGARISTDTVLLVLEVLEARAEDTQTPELDAAWEAIKSEHLPQAGQTALKKEHEMDNKNEHTVEPLRSKRRSFAKVAGIAAAVLIVIFAAGNFIPTAQGTNFWTAFIEWTKETFGFGDNMVEWDESEIPEQLQELHNNFLEYEITEVQFLPYYIPEGYQPVLNKVDDREDVTVFFCHLQNEDDSIMLQYRFWKERDSSAESQRDAEYAEEFIGANGQKYYLAENEGLFNAKWMKGNIECSIFNVSSREELIRILDSIRGE